jgi:hypothetical protein
LPHLSLLVAASPLANQAALHFVETRPERLCQLLAGGDDDEVPDATRVVDSREPEGSTYFLPELFGIGTGSPSTMSCAGNSAGG